jgi:hypothetical protein
MGDAKLVVVQTYNSQYAADIALSALASAGIESMTQADSVGHMRDHIAWSTGGFKILVREEDAADARAALAPVDAD